MEVTNPVLAVYKALGCVYCLLRATGDGISRNFDIFRYSGHENCPFPLNFKHHAHSANENIYSSVQSTTSMATSPFQNQTILHH